MTNPTHASRPPFNFKRFLQSHVYSILIIAALLGVIVYQSRPRPIQPPAAVTLTPPPYILTPVIIKAAEKPITDWLDDFATQSHLRIIQLWNTQGPPEGRLDTIRIKLNDQTGTLGDALEALNKVFRVLAMDPEDDRLTLGEPDKVFTSDRAKTVIYSLGDLLRVDDPFSDNLSRSSRIQEIQDVIKATVSPDQWRDNGGILGSIRSIDDKLIITATPGMHRQIQQILQILQKR